MEDIFTALAEVGAAAMAQGHAAGPGLQRVAEAAAGLEAPRELAPRRLRVVDRYLAQALELAEAPAAKALAAGVAANAEALVWHDSHEAYGADPDLAHFLDNYAYSSLAGPKYRGYSIPCDSQEVLFGITLQGPGVFYPAHAHAAVEVYYVVGGRVDWQQGDGVWRSLVSGDFVLHESGEAHAMRTGAEPLLCLFAWISDLDCAVRLVAPPQA